MIRQYILSMIAASFCFLFALGHRSILYADNELSITHDNDKDKTVYTIGPDKTGREKEEKDKGKAWEMLKNMHLRAESRHGNEEGQSSGSVSQSSQPPPKQENKGITNIAARIYAKALSTSCQG